MKKYSICILIFLVLATSSSAWAQTRWTPVSATVSFKIKNAGLNVDGHFTGLIGTVLFDPEHLAQSSIEASIDAASISTGIELRNNHLKKEEYLNVAKYPKITMKSVSFEKQADGTYKGHFKLILKGVTKEVVIPFTYTVTGDKAVFKGSFTMNRLDYGVGGKSITMADELTIFIQLNVTR